MTAWWDSERREQPKRGLIERVRSVYERRQFRAPAPRQRAVVVDQTAGRIVGYGIDGQFFPAGPCCPDPLDCTRRECWSWFGGEPREEDW